MSKALVKRNEVCQRAIALKNDLENGFLVLAEQLYKIKENSLWRGVYASWEDFGTELKMSRNSINKLVQIYGTFVVSYGIDLQRIKNAGGFSLVADILPAVHSKKDAEHWLGLVETLTRSDLRKELKEAKTGVSESACDHKKCNRFDVCEDCGMHILV